MVNSLRIPLLATALAFVVAVAGCASPEAERVRSGGAGADPGNRNVPAEMRSSAEMYHETPCLIPAGCAGALPESGS